MLSANTIRICLTSVALTITAASLSAQNWAAYKSATGRFAVKIPGEMVEKIQVAETPIGALEQHTFVCEIRAAHEARDNWVYLVQYCDYPEGTVHSDSLDMLEDFFSATQEAAAGAVFGKLTYSAAIDLEGYPGRTWRIDYNKGKAVLKARAFLVKSRLYTIQAACEKEKSMNAAFEKFFNSFRVL